MSRLYRSAKQLKSCCVTDMDSHGEVSRSGDCHNQCSDVCRAHEIWCTDPDGAFRGILAQHGGHTAAEHASVAGWSDGS